MNIHKNCKLTEVNRKHIWKLKCEGYKIKDLATKYNVSRQTISKIIKRARKQEFKPRNSINKRFKTIKYGLRKLLKIENKILEKKDKESKRYNKNYPGEMFHLDTKKLPIIELYKNKYNYLFVAIDDYSRELYTILTSNKSQFSSAKFLEQLIKKCPYKIEKILTDNGKEYKGTKEHEFVKICEKYGVLQVFTKIKTPQTNGKAERVIRTLMEMWYFKNKFNYEKELEISLKKFVKYYNYIKPHKGINGKTPYKILYNHIINNLLNKPKI